MSKKLLWGLTTIVLIGGAFLFDSSLNHDTYKAYATEADYLAYQKLSKSERMTVEGQELRKKADKYKKKVIDGKSRDEMRPSDYEQLIRGYITYDEDGNLEHNPDIVIGNAAEENRKVSKTSSKLTNEVVTEIGPAGGPFAGRTIVVRAHPTNQDIMYAGTSGGGIYKTTDYGKTWISITSNLPNLPVHDIAISAAAPNTLLIGLGDPLGIYGRGVYKTTDGGTATSTWTALGNTATSDDFIDVTQILVSQTDPDKMVVATFAGVFTSTNGGNNFTSVDTLYRGLVRERTGATGHRGNRTGMVWDMEQLDNDNSYILAANGQGIWRTTDFFATISQDAPLSGRAEMAVWPKDRRIAVAQLDNGGLQNVLMTFDAGLNWIDLDITSTKNIFSTNGLGGGGQGWYDQSLEINPLDSTKLIMGGIDVYIGNISMADSSINIVQKSTGYGYREGLGQMHVDQHGLHLTVKDGKMHAWFGNDGGVWLSANNLESFTAKNKGINSSQFYGADKVPGKNIYAGGMQDNGTWVSPENPDLNTSWNSPTGIGGDGFKFIWNRLHGEQGYGTSQNGGWRKTTDGGVSFTYDGEVAGGGSAFYSKMSNTWAAPEFLITAVGRWFSTDTRISYDFGANWHHLGRNMAHVDGSTGDLWGPYPQFESNIAISPVNPNVVWAFDYVNTARPYTGFVSTDGGISFKTLNINISTTLQANAFTPTSGAAAHPTNDSTAFVMRSFYGLPHVIRTTDMGETWTDLSGPGSGFPDVATYSLVVMPWTSGATTEIWVGTEIGIIVSTDNGATWAKKADFPNVAVYDMKIRDGQVVIATHGRGVWKITSDELTTFGNFAIKTMKPTIASTAYNPVNKFPVSVYIKDNYDSIRVNILAKELGAAGDTTISALVSSPTKGLLQTIQSFTFDSAQTRVEVTATAYKGGTAYPSTNTFIDTLTKNPELDVVNSYVNDFNSVANINDDFIVNGSFSINTTAGFSNPYLGTNHPYGDDFTHDILLKKKVKVGDYPFIEFDEIASIEEGNATDLWDYVVVEVSKDGGTTWIEVTPRYDARANAKWATSIANPDSTAFENRKIDLTSGGNFAKDDEVIIRFKIYSDANTNGWGWAIDNLRIQDAPPIIPDGAVTAEFNIIQHPIKKENAYVMFNFNGPTKVEGAMKTIGTETTALTVTPFSGTGNGYVSNQLVLGTNTSVHVDIYARGQKSNGNDNTELDTISSDLATYTSNASKMELGNAVVNSNSNNAGGIILLSNHKFGNKKDYDNLGVAEEFISIKSTKKIDSDISLSFKSGNAKEYSVYKYENSKWTKVTDGVSAKINSTGSYALFSRGSNGAVIPESLTLSNAPNPFNPVTNIKFTLPENSKVSLLIYNALGQKVKTLVNEFKVAGTHKIQWDSRNDFGSKVSSGIYFYKIVTSSKVLTKKMVLIK